MLKFWATAIDPNTTMNRYFESENIAANYAKYRPSYPTEAAEHVMNFYNQNNSLKKAKLMVDVGCGSGQATKMFQPFFERIVGVDVSPEQIKQANKQNKYTNIEFLQGQAENLPIEDRSVDLILVATAVHWFDQAAFYEEAKRILKPSVGCLAIIGYYLPYIKLLSNNSKLLNDAATQLLEDIFLEGLRENPPLLNLNLPCKERYSSIFNSLPFSIKERNDNFHISYDMSLNDLTGWIKSTVPYQTFEDKKMKFQIDKNFQENAENVDPTEKFEEIFLKLVNLKKETIQADKPIAKTYYNFFVLLCRD